MPSLRARYLPYLPACLPACLPCIFEQPDHRRAFVRTVFPSITFDPATGQPAPPASSKDDPNGEGPDDGSGGGGKDDLDDPSSSLRQDTVITCMETLTKVGACVRASVGGRASERASELCGPSLRHLRILVRGAGIDGERASLFLLSVFSLVALIDVCVYTTSTTTTITNYNYLLLLLMMMVERWGTSPTA